MKYHFRFPVAALAGLWLTAASVASGATGWQAAPAPAPRLLPADAWTRANQRAVTLSAAGNARLGYAAPDWPTNAAGFRLKSSRLGASTALDRPDYCLGQWIEPPSPPNEMPGVQLDWDATAALLATSGVDNIVYIPGAEDLPFGGDNGFLCVQGGTLEMVWIYTDGARVTNSYDIAATGAGRPYRLFWTEPPHDGPKISLANRNIRLFGPPEIVNPTYVTNSTGTQLGNTPTYQTTIASGVVLDRDTGQLRAYGELQGQFVLAYYDSSTLDTFITNVVVEVCRADVHYQDGWLGFQLQPGGEGFDTTNLFPEVVAGIPSGNEPPALYLHQPTDTKHPQYNALFAVGAAKGNLQQAVVYWKAADPLGTIWPFEKTSYTLDWDPLPAILLTDKGADDPRMLVPSDYTVTRLKYYSGVPLTVDDTDNSVYAGGEGRSLLQLVKNDDIWFLSVQALRHDNPLFGTALTPAPWTIGQPVGLIGGEASRLTDGREVEAEAAIGACIVAGKNYNPNFYRAPALPSATDDVASDTEDSPWRAQPSVIHAVNTNTDAGFETWWYGEFKDDGMDDAVLYPTLPQHYTFRWPAQDEALEITLASQLGGTITNVIREGKAVRLATTNAQISYTAARYFSPAGATLSFRLRAADDVFAVGRVLTVNTYPAEGVTHQLVLRLDADRRLSLHHLRNGADIGSIAAPGPALPTTDWTSFTLVLTPTGADTASATLWQDGASSTPLAIGYGPGDDVLLWFGAQDGEPAASPLLLDEPRIWNRPLADSEFAEAADNLAHTNLVSAFTFDRAADLEVEYGAGDFLTASDLVSNRTLYVDGCLVVRPGAPKPVCGLYPPGEAPVVYAGNTANAPGWNPNEEHAFVSDVEGNSAVWALRNDLNTPASSEPFVLVQSVAEGRNQMRVFRVTATNAAFPAFGITNGLAGQKLPGPKPITLLASTNNNRDTYTTDDNAPVPVFRDRYGALWFRAAGDADTFHHYPMQDDFFFPSLAAQPAAGTLIPWLARHTNVTADVLTGTPTPWHWEAVWPSNTPAMKIGYTLTTAAHDLPEVWNAASMAVVWPEDDQTVRLFDPTVARGAPLSFSGSDFVTAFGLELGPSGNVYIRNGKYHFRGLPPSIAGRVYYDPAAPAESALRLVGEKVTSGVLSYLKVNILSDAERAALRAFHPAEAPNHAAWVAAVEALATNAVLPNTARTEQGRRIVDYTPVDHYALATLGGATGFVTLVENDATNLVADGHSVSLHVFRAVPEYFTGNIAVIEDEYDALTTRLDLLYTECFAGRAADFEFAWDQRKASETNFTDTGKGGPGVLSFALGGDDTTLDELVNTFYRLRYRARPGTDVHDIMGDAWSDFTEPALAEGWVQRVLNRLTPFAQRMSDLYDHAVETAVSMLQQAGPPFEGDVALNQENVSSVGLLQLYETVLNKAESLSLLLGVEDPDVDDQLLLAASRLANLYILLGNEAADDADNPTIGVTDLSGQSFDYDVSALQPGSMFCFDNQLPSLLDEELALLRGRVATNLLPSFHRSPFFNRLQWNFTKGITAGEVAYVNNYAIAATNGFITEDEAMAQFPQGHGDAWGHYLSALKGYYRLLRNPHFSWTARMGELNVSGIPANVDYFDEEVFAKAAAALADTGERVVDLTARKAYASQGGRAASGYIGDASAVGNGYGEWGVRAGLSTFYNWAVANSMLDANPSPEDFFTLMFLDSTRASLSGITPPATAPWCVEWRLRAWPAAVRSSDEAPLVQWGSTAVTLGDDGTLAARIGTETLVLPAAVSNAVWLHLSLSANASGCRFALRDLSGAILAEATSAVPPPANAASSLTLGGGFTGNIADFRFWNTNRSDAALADGILQPPPKDAPGLCWRFTGLSTDAADTLPDAATSAAVAWTLSNPHWQAYPQSGLDLPFENSTIATIHRGTVAELEALPAAFAAIQGKVDSLDAGLNPLGLADAAISFDLDPDALDDKETHYEQMAARARKALDNASTVLDYAQTHASRIRQLRNIQTDFEETLATEEANLESELVAIYGTPFSGDIGPGGTYEQGYTGPDLYHYAWMDLGLYGLTSIDDLKPAYSIVYYKQKKGEVAYQQASSNSITFTYSKTGLAVKPDSVGGARSAEGRLQTAYRDYLTAYVQANFSRIDFESAKASLDTKLAMTQARLQTLFDVQAINITRAALDETHTAFSALTDSAKASITYAGTMLKILGAAGEYAVPSIIGAGLTVITSPRSFAEAIRIATGTPAESAYASASFGLARAQALESAIHATTDRALRLASDGLKYSQDKANIINDFKSAVDSYNASVTQMRMALIALDDAQAALLTLLDEGERLQQDRELIRRQAAGRIASARYTEMLSRVLRSDALVKYSAAFALAQQYTWLAAKAYDYETGLLSVNADAGDAFLSGIIAARTLGSPDTGATGSGQNGSLYDILARLDANWLVLKSRFGLNNADTQSTWFSLRTGLFRIRPDADGNKAFRAELEKYLVDNLFDLPEFNRLCAPFAAVSGLQPREPALVIPFETSIDFAANLFGKPLGGGEPALDSSHYATKIRAAGVRFLGYNATNENFSGLPGLSSTPNVYLLPVGIDRFRDPASRSVLSFSVVDQVIPLPYTIGSSHLDDPDFLPTFSSCTASLSPAARIRRFPSLRAATGETAELSNARLVGRSVWNTRWLLIIPAGSLHANRDTALDILIHGADLNRDGLPDQPGISDIQIGFQTRAFSGN